MKKATVIILAGQSNAVGVGHIEYLPKYYSPEKIREFNEGYSNIQISFISHNMKSPGFIPTGLHCTELKGGTLGPEVGMADELNAMYPGQEFFIVKCATGGTSLWRDWLSPSGGPEYDPNAYSESPAITVQRVDNGLPMPHGWHFNELVKHVRESLDYLESQGYEPEIRGFCWMQGEADACYEDHNAAYGARYDALLKDFVAAFPTYTETCVFADAGVSTTWPYHPQMNAFKAEYAATHPRCAYIDTIGKGMTTATEPEGNVDIYHYDCGSTVELGRYFIQALGL